jgi:hypothetical protein
MSSKSKSKSQSQSRKSQRKFVTPTDSIKKQFEDLVRRNKEKYQLSPSAKKRLELSRQMSQAKKTKQMEDFIQQKEIYDNMGRMKTKRRSLLSRWFRGGNKRKTRKHNK